MSLVGEITCDSPGDCANDLVSFVFDDFAEQALQEQIEMKVSPDFVIEAAQPADAEILAQFNILMAQETETKSLDPETVLAGVRGVFADSRRGRYLVARKGTEIVGQLLVTLEWSDWRNGEIWWIQSVYVAPQHRGQGVFRALYQALKGEADAKQDVVGLRLYVEYENEIAKQVYESLGMTSGGYLVMEFMKS